MSLAKQISGPECSPTPPGVVHGSQALEPGVLLGDPTKSVSPSSKIQLECGVSRAARLYALRHLMLRSAVPQELLNSSQVEVNHDATVVALGKVRIRLRHAPATFWRERFDWRCTMVHTGW